jgi:hypothetical protein
MLRPGEANRKSGKQANHGNQDDHGGGGHGLSPFCRILPCSGRRRFELYQLITSSNHYSTAISSSERGEVVFRIGGLLLALAVPVIALLIANDGWSLSLVETMVAVSLIVGFAVVAVASTIQHDV